MWRIDSFSRESSDPMPRNVRVPVPEPMPTNPPASRCKLTVQGAFVILL